MPRSLKVWGGMTNTARKLARNGNNQARTIVAATTKKRALELLRERPFYTNAHEFRNYWGETGNPLELATATEEGVWVNAGRRV